MPSALLSARRLALRIYPGPNRQSHLRSAFSSPTVKSSDGQCLFIDPTAGDLRQNLTAVQLKACDGGAGEKFDLTTRGKHIDQDGAMLVVSSLVSS